MAEKESNEKQKETTTKSPLSFAYTFYQRINILIPGPDQLLTKSTPFKHSDTAVLGISYLASK